MTNRLKDKVAFVTAAGQGIGKATAIAFHNEGAKVIATDINDKTLNELNKQYPKIEVKNLDSTNKDAINDCISTISKIDILFNAVGFVHHGTILECDEKDWDFSSKVNVKSMYFMCQAILPMMVKQKGGSIINVSSCASNQSPDPVQAKKDFIARQPMGRLGTAEEIAAVAVYLASDDATFTTGTTISVDGGISI